MTSSTICSHHRIRTVLLMCVVLLSASLHAQAQNKETRINLNIRNATLESFVKQLENATGFSFIYGEEVKLTHRITLEMKQKNISEILQRAFENEPITFEISGKHILLHKRPVPQKPVSRKFTISGYVTDGASSETLIGANILESRRSTGTATNPFGFYSLTLPEGETELVFSYLGYESRHSRFELTKDTLLNVRLDSNNQLAEVVVLSDKREAGIESTAMGAHEIPMTQIRHTPSILGEADLLKTIQLMPGVQAGMEGFAGMYVRGGGPDQNLVMLDGIPVYNADHLLGVFSIFTPEAVKNTTLFKSSFPARYGGRLSSIVDVRTNDGDMHKYHGAFSIGLLTDKLHIEGPIWKERTSFSFSARAIPTLFFKNLIVDKDDTYSDKYNYYFYDVNAKVNHKFSDRIDIGASWVFYTGGTSTIPEEKTTVIRPHNGANNGFLWYGTYDNTNSSPTIGDVSYIEHRNNFRLPASHRLNLGVNFNKKTKHGMRTWNISLYNAYNAMNPAWVYRGHNKQGLSVIKKYTLLPLIPSFTYTYKF